MGCCNYFLLLLSQGLGEPLDKDDIPGVDANYSADGGVAEI